MFLSPTTRVQQFLKGEKLVTDCDRFYGSEYQVPGEKNTVKALLAGIGMLTVLPFPQEALRTLEFTGVISNKSVLLYEYVDL